MDYFSESRAETYCVKPNFNESNFNKSITFLYLLSSYQICPTGTIQFERNGINQGPYRFGERPWLRYSPMLAPYWAPTDLGSFVDGPSKVFYHVYQGPGSYAMLQKATEDVLSVFSSRLPQGKTFFASFALVVTWQDIRHHLQNDITKNLVRLSNYMDIVIPNSITLIKRNFFPS